MPRTCEVRGGSVPRPIAKTIYILKLIINKMKQTLMVKLDTSKEQHKAILETMHRFNEACNYIANTAFEMKTVNKIEIQKVGLCLIFG
ncbi:MAG: hypothetical protein QSU88_04735 [Candidatus Methanoperedens sp.]|nr:hypothetical protein [Candidatus Methanoperedens sp.]